MPCLLVALGLFFPRIVLAVLFLCTTYLKVFQTALWPVVGFILMPYTTLAYAWGMHAGAGTISGFPLVVVIIAVLVDLGVIGGSAKVRRAD
jgi:hypothetical protein